MIEDVSCVKLCKHYHTLINSGKSYSYNDLLITLSNYCSWDIGRTQSVYKKCNQLGYIIDNTISEEMKLLIQLYSETKLKDY